MAVDMWQKMIERLGDIFAQSHKLGWEVSLQHVLDLFADLAQAEHVVLVLLDELQHPLTCIPCDQIQSEALCTYLNSHSAIWKDAATQREMWTLDAPGYEKLWFLPIPPQASSHLATLVFSAAAVLPSQNLLERMGMLLTPLLINARSCWIDYQRIWTQASSVLAEALNQDQVLDKILDQMSRVIPCDASNVMLVLNNDAKIVRWQGYHQLGEDQNIASVRVALDTANLRQMLATQAPVIISSSQTSKVWEHVPEFKWVRSNLTAPIVIKDEVIGFISADSAEPDFFSQQHMERLEIFANYVAIALQNARVYQDTQKQAEDITLLFDELQRRQKYLEGLNNVITTVNSSVNLDEILTIGLREAVEIADMTRGAIYLLDATDELNLRVHQGFTPDEAEQIRVCRLGLGITGRIFSRDGDTLGSIPMETAPIERPWVPYAHISLPLVVENQVVGIMSLDAPERREISSEIQHLLSAIADQLAQSVQRGKHTAQMREQLQTVHYLYETSAAFLSQTNMRGIIFILLRTLTDLVEGTLSTAFYQLKSGNWTRERVYTLHSAPEAVRRQWVEGPAWEAELDFLDACHHERMLVLASRRRGRIPPNWVDIEKIGAGQMLYFPLFLLNYDFFGVLSIMLADDRPMAATESALTWAIIQQGSAALVRVRLYEESRKSENRLRAILESSRDGIFLVGHDAVVHYVNGQAVRLLNLSGDTTTWEGQTLSVVITATRGEAPQFAGWLTQIMPQNNKPTSVPEEDIIFETSHGLFIKLQYTPIYSNHDHNPGSLILLRDITEQRALERMRDDLLSMLVHDMRNPLAVIQNAFQLLDDPNMREMSDEVTSIALTNTEKLLELVNTILDIGRLEAGRLHLDQEAIYLPDHIHKVVRDTTVPTDLFEVQVTVSADLPLLWADAASVERVLQNILSNAFKFVTEGGMVKLSTWIEGDWAVIEIYNTGPHIAPDIYKRLFQKFTAGDHESRGYGLGLAYCKLAIEAHGGQIWARNQPQGGVSFFFTLPVFHVPDFPDEDI